MKKKKIGLKFSEKMSGYVAPGSIDFEDGERLGEKENDFLTLNLRVTIEDVDDFCKISGRKALLEGTVSHRPLGQNLPIREGEFILFGPVQRRVIELRDDQDNTFYTLEEDMDTLNLGSINSNRVVKVAAIKDNDKFRALDRVLEATDFFGKLDKACDQTGKEKEAFSPSKTYTAPRRWKISSLSIITIGYSTYKY
jgi:hypothetical protein